MSAVIAANAFVSLELSLTLGDGTVIHERETLDYVHGYGLLVPGLEARLAGLSAGDTCTTVVPPEEGYGEYDEELVLFVERAELPPNVEVDDEFEAESADGEFALFRVVSVEDDEACIDANHPLAGETLHYIVRIMSLRPASETEVAEAARMFEEARTQIEVDPEPEAVISSGSLKRLN
jgi:FKBP-type peptidyl-prolyl cis-trans isomerase SlyD